MYKTKSLDAKNTRYAQSFDMKKASNDTCKKINKKLMVHLCALNSLLTLSRLCESNCCKVIGQVKLVWIIQISMSGCGRY